MKIPRFTVRRLMVAVAIVGMMLGVPSELLRRRWRFEKIAQDHYAIFKLRTADEGLPMGPTQLSWYPRTPKTWWHMIMFIKYREAARHPWLPVGPDWPEPK